MGLSTGELVWTALGALLTIWTSITFFHSRLVTVIEIVRWFLRCWVGRALLLLAWGEAGWHLFCQHP
jgi:hypothetical protein